MKKGKHRKSNKKIILIIILIISLLYIAYWIYSDYKDLKTNKNLQDSISKIEEQNNVDISPKAQEIIQLEEFNKQNSDIIGWLKIEDTNIDYPVLQTDNNDFYLTHNYLKEYSKSGSLFLDKDFNLSKPSSNYLIYGHRNTNGLMFEDLLKYTNEDFYNTHKIIQFTTLEQNSKYEILAIFYSRVYYKSEKNVFRYYYFVNANNEEEYSNFINNCKKYSIYDTGVTATYGEQLLTLSTCEYSREDGRFAVVAKKIN